jgi:hypothetical protein
LEEQLVEANKKFNDLQTRAAHRRSTTEQKQTLIVNLRPFAGQKVSIVSVLGSDDSQLFANDFIDVFRASGWSVDSGSPSQSIYDKTPIGLEPTMNQEEAQANRVPPSIVALVETLARLGLAPKTAFVSPSIPKDFIEMRVGVRPSN